jgi:predicted RNA binding protein YcfA (HicA-like mRNA interferase family)
MAKLPIISGVQCIKALEHVGYQVSRTRGSHVRLRCPGRKPVTVPRHDELDRGTLSSILRTVEMNTEEFIELLEH